MSIITNIEIISISILDVVLLTNFVNFIMSNFAAKIHKILNKSQNRRLFIGGRALVSLSVGETARLARCYHRGSELSRRAIILARLEVL